MHHVEIRKRAVSADVVDLTWPPFFQHGADRAAVIFHKQPVPNLLAVAVNRQRLVFEGIGDHQRNQLFGKLIRAIVVGGAGDRNVELISREVRDRKQV